jgi:hypothetical protein
VATCPAPPLPFPLPASTFNPPHAKDQTHSASSPICLIVSHLPHRPHYLLPFSFHFRFFLFPSVPALVPPPSLCHSAFSLFSRSCGCRCSVLPCMLALPWIALLYASSLLSRAMVGAASRSFARSCTWWRALQHFHSGDVERMETWFLLCSRESCLLHDLLGG